MQSAAASIAAISAAIQQGRPQQAEQLAREQQFVDPAPQKVVYLEDKQGLAMNQ